jgi:hypothetical protein
MRKLAHEQGVAEPLPGRILARILAEDLRNVRAGGATPTVTEPPGKNRDITNVGSDGDVY